MARTSHVKRSTSETKIEVSLNLDGSGDQDIQTPIPFLDHMLSQLAKHGYFDLKVKAQGVGIAVGKAFKEALGEKKGIRRFAEANVPLNEALAQCVVDISGRAFFVFNVDFPKAKLGEFDVELVSEFFQAFSANSDITLHLNSPYWNNLHHITEALFKAFARSLDSACSIDSRTSNIPSTKGTL